MQQFRKSKQRNQVSFSPYSVFFRPNQMKNGCNAFVYIEQSDSDTDIPGISDMLVHGLRLLTRQETQGVWAAKRSWLGQPGQVYMYKFVVWLF